MFKIVAALLSVALLYRWCNICIINVVCVIIVVVGVIINIFCFVALVCIGPTTRVVLV